MNQTGESCALGYNTGDAIIFLVPSCFFSGYLADVTNDYVWPMRLCFFILITAGSLLLMEFPVRWFYSRIAHRHYLTVSGVTPFRLGHEKPAMNGIHAPYASDCWEVVDSDSGENEDVCGKHNEAAMGVDCDIANPDDDDHDIDESYPHSFLNNTESHLIQSGVSPVPAHLALIDGPHSSAALFVCTQQQSDDGNDSESV